MSSVKSKCAYCGDSPVNHTFAYIGQSLGVWLDPLLSRMTGKQDGLLSRFLRTCNHLYIWFSLRMGILRFGKNIADAATGRSKVIWEEANRRGIDMQQMIIYGKPIEQYRARIKGNTWFYFESLPIPPYLPQKAYEFIDDKVRLKKILSADGIPVPQSISAKNEKEALAAFEKLTKPLIIKPRVGSRGRHTTVFINTQDEFLHAFHIAQKLCKYVAIEEYLVGPVCRATLVDNKLVGFFQAKPPTIIGDGLHTVEQLIDEKNKTKPEKVESIVLTKEHIEYLKRQGYTLDSIVEKDKTVPVLSRTGRFFGGETRECFPIIHPKLKETMERAVRSINVPVVGFDLIIQNPEIDPDTQKWGIIEANSLPFIDLHYFPLYGEPINIAAYVWDLWKDKSAA